MSEAKPTALLPSELARRLCVAVSLPVENYGIVFDEILASHIRTHSPAQAEWLPIESAPKDGNPVLLWWPYWCHRCAIWGYYDNRLGRWVAEQALSTTGDGPLGWQPLPQPPKEQQ